MSTRSANYNRAIHEALLVLQEAEILSFPVNLKDIFRRYRRCLRLMSYGALVKTTGCNRNDCIQQFGGDGATVYNWNTNQAIVYYNEQKNQLRVRFTIAHELGHYFQDHFLESGSSVLQRSTLSKDLYEVLENEANCFARNLLCPAPTSEVVIRAGMREASGINVASSTNTAGRKSEKDLLPAVRISKAFYVTDSAAKVRRDFVSTDLANIAARNLDVSFLANIEVLATWTCQRCGTPKVTDGQYCPVCGANKLTYQVPKMVAPPAVRLSPDGKFQRCPNCGNSTFSDDAKFCRLCGSPIINECTGERHANSPYSKFCTICAQETSFSRHGLIDRLMQSKNTSVGGEIMRFEKFPYDYDRMRVLECPRCGNEEFSDEAQFCRICGLDLYNTCDGNPPPDQYNWGNPQRYHSNPPNARFCECCGARTTYLNLGVLKPYEEFIADLNAREELNNNFQNWQYGNDDGNLFESL